MARQPSLDSERPIMAQSVGVPPSISTSSAHRRAFASALARTKQV